KKNKTVIEKMMSMVTLLFLAGLFSLCSGFYTGEPMQYFWGVMIMGGSIVLYFVRKKDWKKHWEEQEDLKKRHDAVRAREREMKAGAKDDQ
ncbi:MAG TPA: hypothetical protein VN652_08030, partial [Geobacteraceae bacterium]|nr:hypothetical protein [Geobacteraceae bacterium]